MKTAICIVLIALAVILAIAAVVAALVNSINRAVRRTVGINAGEAVNILKQMSEAADDPAPKSVSGATDIYLKQIRRDFPEYHNPEAISEIKTAVSEYISIKCGEKSGFDSADVGEFVLPSIKVSSTGAAVSAVDFHGVSICGFEKTSDYATVKYQVSVGYNSGRRFEERYEVLYTLKLTENGISSHAMRCPNCGGTLNNSGDKKCPYCDADIILDTVLNWVVTSISER